ncbi:PEP/pyruvate-binding domain-containing protein [Methylomicrobium lacus]|uniref:PEP/pyruvate-binding domain-containing protein n=1 Tax=Methylomicrobium lacus TaxID=136992 RepID=UPI0035A8FE3F
MNKVINPQAVSEDMVVYIDPASEDVAAFSPERIGFKAHNLWRMARAGLPVPPAFVVTTEACRAFHDAGGRLPDGLDTLIGAQLRRLESATGRNFNGSRRPLIVSVRSGAPVSMPGMLETVLDVGLNDVTVRALTRQLGNPRLAWDSYRRFVESFAHIAQGLELSPFARLAHAICLREGAASTRELDALALRELLQQSQDTYHALTGSRVPQDPNEQLLAAIAAVFRSWNSPKAREYRRLRNFDENLGTTATVQVMVFGNAGGASGSGVGFTRNPSTGANELYVDFLANAQGEDVVSGRYSLSGAAQIDAMLPAVGVALRDTAHRLERLFGDMQEFEFTVEEGDLKLLQTRTGQRTRWAACQIAVDLIAEGLTDFDTALGRVQDIKFDKVMRLRVAPDAGQSAVARATPASLGVATGAIALDCEAAKRMTTAGQPCLLIRGDTSTDDIAGLAVCAGVLTAAGGRTAHAAVVARQLDKVCLVDCRTLEIDMENRRIRFGNRDFEEGDILTLDGETGDVYSGKVAVRREKPTAAIEVIRRWQNSKTC